MDFEFAGWQMIYLLVAPQKVYRNFMYRKSNSLDETILYSAIEILKIILKKQKISGPVMIPHFLCF